MGGINLELPPSSPINERKPADIYSTPPAAQSKHPQSPSTPRAKPTCSDEVSDGLAYPVIDTPGKGRRVVFRNKQLDLDFDLDSARTSRSDRLSRKRLLRRGGQSKHL